MQVYVDAPNQASGPIPEDVKPYFEGPYYEWWNAEKVCARHPLFKTLHLQHLLTVWQDFHRMRSVTESLTQAGTPQRRFWRK